MYFSVWKIVLFFLILCHINGCTLYLIPLPLLTGCYKSILYVTCFLNLMTATTTAATATTATAATSCFGDYLFWTPCSKTKLCLTSKLFLQLTILLPAVNVFCFHKTRSPLFVSSYSYIKDAVILAVYFFGCVKKRDNMTNMTNEIQDMASEMQSFQNSFVQIYHRLFCNIVYTDARKQHRLTCWGNQIGWSGHSPV